jgi:quinoprotein dehydrogenase-associated probable ABC transporter substrate-binding protein
MPYAPRRSIASFCATSVTWSMLVAAPFVPAACGRASDAAAHRDGAVLRVCADPNNLPFSNRRGEGFENRIAEMLAHEMNARVEYTWWAQRRGFFRNTLNACNCDVVIGVPSGIELASATRPYYRSTYVFVYRKDRGISVSSLDDPALRRLKIGVQIIGDDYTNTPPAHALARRNIIRNVVGYTVYGDYRTDSPPAAIIDAVASGAIDVAIAWGPLAGYFAQRSAVPLAVVPVSPQIDLPYLPFVFDIAMGVRRKDTALHNRLDEIIERRQGTIDSILALYGVPRVDRGLADNRSGGEHDAGN